MAILIDNSRTLRQFKVSSQNEVTLRLSGSSRHIKARAVEIIRNDQGLITYVCLDRLIHRQGEEGFRVDLDSGEQVGALGAVETRGCFATELVFQTVDAV